MPGFGFGARPIARRRAAASTGSAPPLTAGVLSVAENSAAGTVVGTFGGGRTGASITLIDTAGGRLALAGRTLIVGSTPIDFELTPALSITVRQSAAGFSDVDQTFGVTVTNLFETSNLVALGLSASSFTIGTPASGTIVGATAGSTIEATGLPAGLTINGTQRTWAYDGSGAVGSASVTLTETLADSANSPRSTAVAVTITAAGGGAPALASPASAPADPRVGMSAAGTGATFTGAESVAHEVFADGTKVADGTSYTPVAGDFNKVLEYRSTAVSGGGTTVSRAYAPVTALFDSLTGPDSSAILSHTGESGNAWVKNSLSTYNGDAIIVGNKLGRGASANVMVYGFTPPSASYVVEANLTTGSTIGTGGAIAFRMNGGAATFYAFGLVSTSSWGMTKRSGNTVRTSDISGVAPHDAAPFGGSSFSAASNTTATAVKIAPSTTYAVAIHVWDEGSTVQFAIYLNNCLIIRAQDADATRITAAGNVGWYDTQSAAVTATTGNKVSNMRVHLGRLAPNFPDGRNPNTGRIDDKPMQAIAPTGSLDLRGVARAVAANDNGTYTRQVGGWCEGGTTDVKVRVEKAVGGDTVLDWVTPTGLMIAGPRWFGTVDLPRNEPTANSAGDAWDVLRFRAFRGATVVRTGTSARFGNGIGMTFVGSSIAAVFAESSTGPNGMLTPSGSFSAAGLAPNRNTALLPRYSGTTGST